MSLFCVILLTPECPMLSVITHFRAMYPASVITVPYPEGYDQHGTVPGQKRPPAMLTLPCGVCGAPAPDHKHFGGREYNIVKD
jgi:hypothetical protein